MALPGHPLKAYESREAVTQGYGPRIRI